MLNLRAVDTTGGCVLIGVICGACGTNRRRDD